MVIHSPSVPILQEIHKSPSSPILQEIHNSPLKPSTSPSYAEILKKKVVDSYGSSDKDTFEQSSKKIGRKSRTEIREEEVERLKTQGS